MVKKQKDKKINPIFEGNKTEIKKDVEAKPQNSPASIFQNIKLDDILSTLNKVFNPNPPEQNTKIIICPPHDWQEFSDSFVCKNCGKIVNKNKAPTNINPFIWQSRIPYSTQ